MFLCGLLGLKGFVFPDQDMLSPPHSYTSEGGYSGDDNSFGGAGKNVGLIAGSLALLFGYCICNIELYATVLPLIGLRKIREIHLDVMDGTIEGEAEVEEAVIQIQDVCGSLPPWLCESRLPVEPATWVLTVGCGRVNGRK